MAILKAAALDGFLRRPDPAIRALLIYGSDAGEVSDAARRVLHKLTGFTADSLAVTQLDERAIAADPGRLADEVQSLSLLGGKRVVWIRGADSQFAKAVAPLLAGSAPGNFILGEAAALGKSSPLRALFEESEHALALPLYEATEESAAALIENMLRDTGLKISSEARLRLVELTGCSAPLLRQEVEKLALYCNGSDSVGVDDVAALCGAGGEVGADDLIFAAFSGDVERTDRQLGRLLNAGVDAGRLAMLAHQHVTRLIDLRQAVDRGMSADQAVKSARPPIFFKSQPAFVAQLLSWSLQALLGAAASVAAAVRDGRLMPGLSDVLVGRMLLATARKARAARLERV